MAVRSKIINRITNVKGITLHNSIRSVLLLAGFMVTKIFYGFGFVNFKLLRHLYLYFYFFGKNFTDKKQIDLLKPYIKSANYILDIGAAFGFYAYKFAKINPQSQVIAFEPDPILRTFIEDKISIKKLTNVKVEPYALWDKKEKLDLYVCYDNPGENSIFKAPIHKKSIKVEAISLDEYWDSKQIDLVKIDVQGAEYKVLLGMLEVLKRSNNLKILLEYSPQDLIDSNVEPGVLIQLLKNHNFNIYRLDTKKPQKVESYHDLMDLDASKLQQCDLLCMKK